MAETVETGREGAGARLAGDDMTASDVHAWFVREVLPLEAALMHFLRHSLRNKNEAEDLCQDVYVRVYQAALKKIPDPAKPFLFTVARNLLLNRVRHEAIVSSILNTNNARLLTLLIGLAEIVMAAWILTGVHRQLNVLVQILIIIAMNALEFFLAPDLLLWGRANAIFAFAFILLIYGNEMQTNKQSINKAACYPS